MSLGFSHNLMLAAYGTAWRVARPVLDRNKRLKHGLSQRLVPYGWSKRAHVWIQAASGGEAYLAWQMLREMPDDQQMTILLTSCTKQGIEVLEKAREWAAKEKSYLDVVVNYFPYDQPHLMTRAVEMVAPKTVVLLETELWPGLMTACAVLDIPVVVFNGRMNPRSLAGYLATIGFWRRIRPTMVHAISDKDARRYSALFGEQGVYTMNNIKFDSVSVGHKAGKNPLVGKVVKKNTPLVVLGSVREEEESDILDLVIRLKEARPKTSIALFPRHMERVGLWEMMLNGANQPFVLRSKITEPPAPGTVILWDAFGELGHAYQLARAVFVGGSLAPLGGQNFLEPLAAGKNPVIGTSYHNFQWAAGVIDEKMVYSMDDVDGVFDQIMRILKRSAKPDTVKKRFAAWLQDHQGGTKQVLNALLLLLKRSS
ncbi:3-deoxy-D-manno-octulosonic acid transferase [Halodesulfovibrio marinisediminis]|uniref:3-deoxy-D-manno-octulosonic acid transferase n=1 Tax=Halodesulfovibrio marinisediminis DSM 17456 TaxID=1121457 RepID=A0A1N6J133_9BACT|nr:glycosyltransferase N-terminal domain-containing protein [Halodesulfovibrio marinisediminis]SIO37945.1 3-deoxy-D-manno-octulosonic-acid transferase [Halodesulfovibrio marinisediminis DSM 17456]